MTLLFVQCCRTMLWSEHRDHSVFSLCFLHTQTHQRYKSAREHHSMSETVLKGYQTVQWMTLQQSRERVMTGLFVFHALPSRNAINRNWVSHENETVPSYFLFLISQLKQPTLSSGTKFTQNSFCGWGLASSPCHYSCNPTTIFHLWFSADQTESLPWCEKHSLTRGFCHISLPLFNLLFYPTVSPVVCWVT